MKASWGALERGGVKPLLCNNAGRGDPYRVLHAIYLNRVTQLCAVGAIPRRRQRPTTTARDSGSTREHTL